jgi:hypothetical protein
VHARVKHVASLVAVGIAAVAFACVRPLPHQICSIGEIESLPAPPGADVDAYADDCNACLETPCCDTIGFCDGDCRARVKHAHACILQEGRRNAASREPGCLIDAGVRTDDAAAGAYECMRSTCGERCGLPVCTVNPALDLFINAPCDRCAASHCCAELNTCAADRGCKLLSNCISACGSLLGNLAGFVNEMTVDGLLRDICAGKGRGILAGVDPGSSDAGGDCVVSCLNEFLPQDDTDGGDLALTPGCLGFAAVACIVHSGCTECAGDAAAPDAAGGARDAGASDGG